MSVPGRNGALALLTLGVIICNVDRMVIAILFVPIQREFGLHDWQLGLLTGLGFTAFYAGGSFFFARLAERRDRVLILSIAIGIWSVMTLICGMATSFAQLLLARMGVGAAESGCQPISHSLISDFYEQDERPFATGIYAAGALAGGLVALPLGGWIAQAFGWRAALIAVGLPGLLVALALRLSVRDRWRGPNAPAQAVTGETLGPALRAILADAALFNAIIGAVLFTIASAASLSFGPLYLIRAYGLDTAQAGLAYGVCSGATAIGANVLIGWLTSRLVKRDLSWAPRVAAIGSFFMLPSACLFLLAPTLPLALLGLAIKSIAGVVWLGPIIATVQMVAPPHRRATAAACLVASYTLIGFGLGPVLAGGIADLLRPRLGEMAIGGGLLALQPFAVWAGFHFLRSATVLRRRQAVGAAPISV